MSALTLATRTPLRLVTLAQGRPFDVAQGRPFDVAQGRPFDVAQGRPGLVQGHGPGGGRRGDAETRPASPTGYAVAFRRRGEKGWRKGNVPLMTKGGRIAG